MIFFGGGVKSGVKNHTFTLFVELIAPPVLDAEKTVLPLQE